MGRWEEGSNKHGEVGRRAVISMGGGEVGRRAVISMGRWEGGQ